MGAIADEVERDAMMPLKAVMSMKQPILVEGHKFIAMPLVIGPSVIPGGPLGGVLHIETPILDQQLDELTKALGLVAKSIRKLEDEFNKPKLPMRPIIGGHRR